MPVLGRSGSAQAASLRRHSVRVAFLLLRLSGYRQPPRLPEDELGVGDTLGEGVAEEEGGVRRSEHCRGIDPVNDPPIAGNEPVTWVTEEELIISDAGGQRVAEVEEARRFAVEADLVDVVAVPVPNHRLVAQITEKERELRRPKPGVIGTKLVDDIEPCLARTVDRPPR